MSQFFNSFCPFAAVFRFICAVVLFAGYGSVLPAQTTTNLKLGLQPAASPAGRWQLTWQSVPGQRYRLERSPDLEAVPWTEVTTITAADAITVFTDPQPLSGVRNFWRVVVIGNGPDGVPPVVSIIDARLVDQAGAVALELRIRATDNISVTGVNYTEGVTQLGAATAGPVQTWTRIVPLVSGAVNPRQFQAVARDAAGNTGFSDIYTYRPQQAYPAGMRPLGGAGVSAAGIIGEKPDGSLQPFTWMPDSNAGASPQRALRVDFAQGASLVQVSGNPGFRSGKITFGFGPQSPLRFDPAALPATAALASAAAEFAGFGLSVPLSLGQTAQIAADGGLSYDTVRQLLGLPSGTGIPLLLFERFSLLWQAGTWTHAGLTGGRFALPGLNLPLPPQTGDYATAVLNLLSGDRADFPVTGSWPLPGTGATLNVARARPLVLTLRPDGTVSLRGPVTMQFANGLRVQGTIILDDPVYKFCLESDTLSFPLMGLLEGLLPNQPANCLPAGFTAPALDSAEECLRSYDRAYRSFTQAALNLRPDATSDTALSSAAGPQDLVAAAIECWAATAATDVAASLPIQPVRDFVNLWWKPSLQTDDFITTLQNFEALRRVKKAADDLANAGLNGADETALTQDLDAALLEAKAAVIAISQTPAANRSLENIQAITALFVELNLNLNTDADLIAAARSLYGAYITKVANTLGITAGQTSYLNNPAVRNLGYEAALEHFKPLHDVLAEAQRLNISDIELPLVNEVRSQLILRAGDHLLDRLAALAGPNSVVSDPGAALLVAGDIAEFLSFLQILGIDETDLPGLPVAGDVEAAVSALDQTLVDSLAGTGLPLSEIFDRGVALTTALDALNQLNPASSFSLSAQRRIHSLIQTNLPVEATLAVAGNDVDRLERVRQAGFAFGRLSQLTSGITTTYQWEGPPVGEVCSRLATLLTQQKAWGRLRTLKLQLLDEADAMAAKAEAAAATSPATAQARQQSRKRYLSVLSDVLVIERAAIVAFWQETNTLRNAQPAAAKSDGFLSGDLTVERLRGCLGYDRVTQVLTGSFGGRIGFPADGAFFEIVSATLASNGSFNIQTATQLPLEPFGNPNVKLSGTLGIIGTDAGLQSVSGTGQLALKIPGQNGVPAGSQNYNVSYGYSNTAPGQPLTLTASLATQNAPLKFGDDFVLFGGTLTADWKTGSPGGFSIGLGGRAGLFHRENPLTAPIAETDFWAVTEINQLALAFDPQKIRATFTGGVLSLPEDIFVRNTAAPVDGLKTRAILTGQLCVDVPYTTGVPLFCANGNPAAPFTADFENFHFAVPGVPKSKIDVTHASVEFFQNQFPVMKSLAASFAFPLPGTDATDSSKDRLVSLDVTGKDWRIDGFPREASFALNQNLRLADLDGLDVDLLGGTAVPGCQTLFSLTSQPSGPRLTLNGGMRVQFEEKLARDANTPPTALAATACGSFAWDFATLPDFQLSTAQIAGRFRLGGEQGIVIGGTGSSPLAVLSFSGLENLHRLTNASPFVVNFTGALEVQDFVKFGLKDANLKWNGNGLLPAVSLGGVQTDLGSESVKLASGFLPVYPTGLGAEFIDNTLPLFPTGLERGRFDPLNLRLLVSGGVSIPPPVADELNETPSDLPGLAGTIDQLGIGLKRQGNLIVPDITLNGLGLKLSGIDLPPLGGLTGSLYVGNLNDPPNLYFAGTVGGTVNDVGAKIGMGVHRTKGLLGATFDLDIGPAGIPIDGGALGGILLTGGSGGLSFGNTFANPADFLNSIQFTNVNGEKRPVNDASPDAFPSTGSPSPLTYPTTPPEPSNASVTCLNGQFPPATINPLCKPHPTIPGRVVFKGTDLRPGPEEPNTDLKILGIGPDLTLASIGITPGSVPSSINAAVAFGVDRVMAPVRDFKTRLLASIPPAVNGRTKAYFAELLEKQIHQLETTAAGFLRQALGQALGVNPNASLYQAITDAVAKGIPCLDATLRVQGNFSHAAVSTVLKGEGSVTLSTTGTATMEGAIKLVGIPVGEGTLAFSLTDTQGNINPSFGGVLNAGIGPLTLGDMSMAYQCDGCFDAVLNAFTAFLATNAENMGAASRQLLMEMMNRTVPLANPRPPDGDPGAFFVELEDRQKLAFVASLFNVVEVLGNNRPLPPGITGSVVGGFISSFQQFVSDVLLQVNPRFCFQAKLKPSLFGFPLIPGPTPFDARFAYEKVNDPGLGQSFQQLSANATFSPAFVMASLTTGSLAMLVPSVDQANLGFSFRMPAFTPETVDLSMRNPGLFAQNQFASMVQDSTLTFSYAFMPLGIPLAQGQARVIMPRLAQHPANPNRAGGPWVLPSGTTRATRDEVIIAALVRGRLQDPNWRGNRGELDDLFFQPFANPPTAGSREERIVNISQRLNATQMNDLGFADDYFPHGGIIGAAELQLPSVVAQAPPFELIGKVFDPANPNWLADTQNLFANYLTANTTVGQMAAYIPAPNVPQGFDFNSANNGPQQLIDSLITGDPLSIIKKTAPNGIYPFDQVLLAGWAKAQLLGMPLAEGRIIFEPASNRFALSAGVPDGSWLKDMVGASLSVTIKQPAILNTAPAGNTMDEVYASLPKKTIKERFDEMAAALTNAPAAIGATISQIQNTLPKISAEASASIQIPPALAPFLRTQANAGVSFFAFSPGYDPSFGLNGAGTADDDFSPFAVSQRRGGLGVKGKFDLSYTPPAGQPLVIKIDDASFSVTPGAQNLFPALTGQLLASQISIPGAPTVRKGVVQFASSPDNGAPYLRLGLEMDPFKVTVPGQPSLNLLNFTPLSGAVLGGNLSITRADGQPGDAAVNLRMNPMSVAIPMLGTQVAVALHGGQSGPGVFDDFSFSTQSDQVWSAQMTISQPGNFNAAPTLEIRDPLNPSNPQVLMSVTASGPLNGTLGGTGLTNFQGQFTVTGNASPAVPTLVTFYPGTEQQSTLELPSASGFIVAFDSTGRFYCNLGALTNINLPGLMSANAKIEFGFNPDEPQPDVARTPSSLSFSPINLVASASQPVTISNNGTRAANISLEVTHPDSLRDFELAGDSFQLEPGGSRTLRILFQPKAGGVRTGTLRLNSDDPDSPLLTVPLSGTGLVQPVYFASRPAITFGRTLVGGTSSSTFTIGNSGSAAMTVNSATLPAGSPFTVSPAGLITLQPGEDRLYTATFSPTAIGSVSRTLTLAVASPIGSRTLTLSGTGSDSSWVTVLDSATTGSTASLNAVKMLDDQRGWVAGNAGTLLETRNGGRSWSPRRLTNQNLNAFAISDKGINEPEVAGYHFEEPPGSPSYLDGSGNRRHGIAPVGPEAPALAFSNGRFGSGLHFDGINDYAELGTFALPQDFSISLWARFESVADGQAILGKYTSTGLAQFLFGKYGGGFRVFVGSQPAWTVPATPVLNVWSHFTLTGNFDAVTNTTTMTMDRDGISLGSHVFTGAVDTPAGKPWVLSTDWDSSTARSEFFRGSMDEVRFFNGLISSSERTSLRTQNGRRLVVAGHGGLVYETFSDGDTWGQLPDLNAYGWRNQTRTFERRDWFSASFDGEKLYLGGRQVTFGSNFRKTVMLEDFADGADGLNNTADDEFAEVSLPGSSAFNPGLIVLGLATQGQNKLFVSNEGIAYQQSAVSPGAATALTPTAAASLNAAAAHGLFTQYTAVGNGGAILSANNGAFGTRTSGTTANLRGIAFTSADPAYHVVGDGGAYLTSDNNGVNWTVVNDGLTGDMRAVDARVVPGGAATEYHTWAVGAQSVINYRPPAEPSGAFFTCYPGQLDYGFVTTNESRTLVVTIANRGKQALTVSASGASISGPAASRFSLALTSIGRLEPGDTTEIPVRYRPTGTSEFDYAELSFATNDAGQAFRVPLFGQSAANEWRPVVIATAAGPVLGEVVNLEFISANLGYALVNPPAGASRLFRTENGGSSWAQVGSNFPNLGGTLRFTSLAYTNDFLDIIHLGGRVENASGTLIKGVVLIGWVESLEIAPGEFQLQEQWSDHTPLSAGQTIQPLAISDLGAFSYPQGSAVVAATTGSSSTATIYKRTTGAWSTTTNRPSPTFNGGPVAVSAFAENTAAFRYYGATATEVFANGLTATSWPAAAKKLQTGSAQTIRDLVFDLDVGGFDGVFSRGWLVGDDGLFFRLRDDVVFPASDAEVFGTTDLKAVDFSGRNNGWVVGQSRIFNTTDEGATWALNFDAGSNANLLSVKVLSGAKVWSGGSLDGKATVWRYTPPPAVPKPLLSSVSFRDFGTVAAGSATSTQNIAITNTSSTALDLQEISISGDESRPRFRLVGQPPASVPASGTVNIGVVFDAAMETSIADTMAPEFLHRFEGDWADTVYRDDSLNHRDATAPTATAQRPVPATSDMRDRCLRFDGTDDRLEIPGALEILPASWSVSLWAAPEAVPSGDRVLLSKDLSSGGDGLKILLTSSGYRVVIRGAGFTGGGVPDTGFQHLVVTGVQSGSSTLVTVYRDGAPLWSQSIAAVAGDLTGRPWTLGAEWTSATVTAGHFLGCLDDIGLFPRLLTDREIAILAAKSPVYGGHRAQLVVNSGSENGVRNIDLRAFVPEASDMMVFNTEPAGRSLVIDGVAFTTPAAFAVTPFASGSTSAREWAEGSRHTITTQDAAFTLTNPDGSSANYVFGGWSSAATRQWVLTASRSGSMSHTASFVPGTVSLPAPISPPPGRVVGPNPLIAGLANSPRGPFFRLSEGSLKLPNLGATGFAITGELFVSLTKLQGQLETTALNLPDSGQRHLEIGASRWLVDATAGGNFLLKARPPSLRLFGTDVLPDGQTTLRFTKAAGVNPAKWSAEFRLLRDYKPAPDLLEFAKGFTKVEWLAGGLPGFALELQGGLRLLKLPNGAFAFNQAMNVKLDTINFNVGINSLLASAGLAQPSQLFSAGPLRVGWGDVRLRRSNGGPVFLELVNLPFDVNGANAATVSGSLNTNGVLSLTGTLTALGNGGKAIRLDSAGQLTLEKSGSGAATFDLLLQALPSPRFALSTPTLILKSTAKSGSALPSGGLTIPGIELDTSGAFDTGRLALPAFTFDGIGVSGNPSGKRRNNYIRLARDPAGTATFSLKSEQQFLACRQNLNLSVTSGTSPKLSGSFSGNFCVLPEPISLKYDSSKACQFEGNAFGFTIRFGTNCAEVTW